MKKRVTPANKAAKKNRGDRRLRYWPCPIFEDQRR
jgi:hypothetical protein